MAKRARKPDGSEVEQKVAQAAQVADVARAEPGADGDAPGAEAGDEASPAPAGEGAASEDLAALQTQLESLQARADEHWDRLLRTQAEMENLRKRSQREVENAHKYALEGFAGELLSVRDSLEMGLSAAGEDGSGLAGIKEGTELTLKLLSQAMDKHNIREINPLGEKFDPELHQAMNTVEDASAAPNTVVMVIQKGYTLNDRLLRPALVSVAR